MSEFHPTNRLPYVPGTVLDVAATNRDGKLIRGSMVPAVSSGLLAVAEQDGTDLLITGLALLVRSRLEQHPHFRGRASRFTIELVGQTIVVTGRLPSYYLKQLLQEAIKATPGVVNVDNQVHVVWPNSYSLTETGFTEMKDGQWPWR
jgi:hypothetical protein